KDIPHVLHDLVQDSLLVARRHRLLLDQEDNAQGSLLIHLESIRPTISPFGATTSAQAVRT
ncbi:hypothetical protein F443_14904, partial [Phytophthora nicotianae P1569]